LKENLVFELDFVLFGEVEGFGEDVADVVPVELFFGDLDLFDGLVVMEFDKERRHAVRILKIN